MEHELKCGCILNVVGRGYVGSLCKKHGDMIRNYSEGIYDALTWLASHELHTDIYPDGPDIDNIVPSKHVKAARKFLGMTGEDFGHYPSKYALKWGNFFCPNCHYVTRLKMAAGELPPCPSCSATMEESVLDEKRLGEMARAATNGALETLTAELELELGEFSQEVMEALFDGPESQQLDQLLRSAARKYARQAAKSRRTGDS